MTDTFIPEGKGSFSQRRTSGQKEGENQKVDGLRWSVIDSG